MKKNKSKMGKTTKSSFSKSKSRKKSSKIKFGSPFLSKKTIVIFSVLFALVGSYLIYQSYAASPGYKIKSISNPTAQSRIKSSKKHRFVVTMLDDKGEPEIQTSDVETAEGAKKFATDVVSSRPGKTLSSVEWDAPVSPTGTYDPLEPQQWYIKPPVNFQAAYFYGRGSGVKVSVIDSAILCSHQDLQLTNNGIDYVSDDSNACSSSYAQHGTHIAGIIAARQQNNLGISGAAPQSTVIPIRVLNSEYQGYMSDVAKGITWSVNNGVRVVNISLGSGYPSTAVSDAVNYAWNNRVFVVASAGNQGKTDLVYPAAITNVIAVGSVNKSLVRSGFSNYGSWVDVFAPGENIITTSSTSTSSYTNPSGTSMAAPLVAAELADMISQAPSASNSGLRTILQAAVTDLGARGFDSIYSHGLIDPHKAQKFLHSL